MNHLTKECALGRDDLLMDSLIKFYRNDANISKMMPIITGKSPISLRIIDWFVTNYSKKNNIMIVSHNKNIFIYLDYKSQLKAYSKKQFDPFCRRNRISFIYDEVEEVIETTVGQLNFFKWAITNDILEYIENNLSVIEKDMNSSIHSSNRKKIKSCDKKRQKRHELSISATRTVSRYDIKINLTFE